MEKVQFRPHHIFRERFLRIDFRDRGEEFEKVEQRTKDIIQEGENVSVEVTEGIDELCRACPNCRDERCQSSQGDEEAVRKFDHIILKGLGVSYGEIKTPKQWRGLIEQKAPLEFCRRRCHWKSRCTVFRRNEFGEVAGS